MDTITLKPQTLFDQNPCLIRNEESQFVRWIAQKGSDELICRNTTNEEISDIVSKRVVSLIEEQFQKMQK